MYLHLGQNTIVHESEILGIFDLDITSQSYRTRQYLNRAERNGEVVSISEDFCFPAHTFYGQRSKCADLLCNCWALNDGKRRLPC